MKQTWLVSSDLRFIHYECSVQANWYKILSKSNKVRYNYLLEARLAADSHSCLRTSVPSTPSSSLAGLAPSVHKHHIVPNVQTLPPTQDILEIKTFYGGMPFYFRRHVSTALNKYYVLIT